MRFSLILCLLPTIGLADGFAALEGDTPLTRADVVAMTQAGDLVFYEGGRSRYSVGGAYSYTYASGESAFGTFDVAENGTICIAYRNGRSRCDRFVRSHGRLVMLTADGQRFPIR